jgi:hypothetical protein
MGSITVSLKTRQAEKDFFCFGDLLQSHLMSFDEQPP